MHTGYAETLHIKLFDGRHHASCLVGTTGEVKTVKQGRFVKVTVQR